MDFATIDVAFDVMPSPSPSAKAGRQKKKEIASHDDEVSNEVVSLLNLFVSYPRNFMSSWGWCCRWSWMNGRAEQ
jgi:hypothetical protein